MDVAVPVGHLSFSGCVCPPTTPPIPLTLEFLSLQKTVPSQAGLFLWVDMREHIQAIQHVKGLSSLADAELLLVEHLIEKEARSKGIHRKPLCLLLFLLFENHHPPGLVRSCLICCGCLVCCWLGAPSYPQKLILLSSRACQAVEPGFFRLTFAFHDAEVLISEGVCRIGRALDTLKCPPI